MADNWYYVQKGNRQGPVTIEALAEMVTKQELKADDFVWKKGFDNWKKIKDVSELEAASKPEPEIRIAPVAPPAPVASAAPVKAAPANDFPAAPIMHMEDKEFSFTQIKNHEDRVIFLRIGNDRGGAATDYGPFSLVQVKKLFKENRINGKTFLFTSGMKEWKILGDIADYEMVFEELPPVLKDTDRRTSTRKPFIARLFVQNNKKLFEGLCRDISIGGMQVLVNDFKGLAGDKISINVHPDNTDYHFTASGVVVRILEGNCGFSFRFQSLSDEAKSAIEKYVQEN